jgi:hypothetical protein
MFSNSNDRRVRSKDGSVVVHVLHQNQHRLGDEVPLTQVTVRQGENELVLRLGLGVQLKFEVDGSFVGNIGLQSIH